MDQQLHDLYHRHVGTAFDRQLRLADFLRRKAPGAGWEYDTATATLAFGPVRFEAPVIGSHAENNNSWLWAWANRHLRLTLTNRALGDVVRGMATRLGLHAINAPGFALEPLLGPLLTEHAAHVLGIVVSRELGYDAYYTAPYEGGRATVLIRDDRLRFTERDPLRRVLVAFPQVISALPVSDHRAALAAYARDSGLTATEEAGRLRIASGRNELTATFDARGRLANLQGSLGSEPAAPAPKKPAAKKAPAAKPKKAAPKKRAAKAPPKKAAPKKSTPKKKPGKKR